MRTTTTRKAVIGLGMFAALLAPTTAMAADAPCGTSTAFGRVAVTCTVDAPAEIAPAVVTEAAPVVEAAAVAAPVVKAAATTITNPRPQGAVRAAASRQVKLADSVITWFSDYSYFRGGRPTI